MHLVRAAIDDWGDAALLLGDELDVELVAPLSGGRVSLHLTLRETFHGGPEWVRDGVEPLRGALRAGEVELFHSVERVDAASAALQLRLARAVGLAAFDDTVRTLVLVPPGPGGRFRVDPAVLAGASSEPSPLEVPVDLVFDGAAPAVVVRSEAGVRAGGPPAPEVRVELPLDRRIDVSVPAAGAGRPPFGIALLPAPR